MTDIVERLRKRQMMQDVRGTGDRFVKQVAVPDALCQLAADEIERLRAELAAEKDETFRLQCSHSALYNECTALRAELAALRAASASVQADQREAIDQARELLRIVTAERDALRADALRYRWLRERCAWLPIDYMSNDDAADDFDAAIDAAMASQTTGTAPQEVA